MISFLIKCLLESLTLGILAYLVGSLFSFFKKTNSNPQISTTIFRGIAICVVLFSLIFTKFQTINIGVIVLCIAYLMIYKKQYYIEFPKWNKIQLKVHALNIATFFIFITAAFLISVYFIAKGNHFNIEHIPLFYDLYHYHGAGTRIIEQHAETSFYYWNQLPKIDIYNYHYFEIWIDVICMFILKSSSFNIFVFVVAPFLCGMVLQSIYDLVILKLNARWLIFPVVIVLAIICGQSFFNDSFFLKSIPTSRNFLIFSPIGIKLNVIYILLFQSVLEFSTNKKILPLSLVLVTAFYLTTIPLVILSIGFFAIYQFNNYEKKDALKSILLAVLILANMLLIMMNSSSDELIPMESTFKLTQIKFNLVLKYFVTSIIQSLAQTWFLLILIILHVWLKGFKESFRKYNLYYILLVTTMIFGSLFFTYLKIFMFDIDQFYYNIIMPLISCFIVILLVDLFLFLKSSPKKFAFPILITFSIVSFVLNYKRLIITYQFIPPFSSEYVTDKFVNEVSEKLNAKNKRIHGISISQIDKLHHSFEKKVDFIMIGFNWTTFYLQNATYQTNFSKAYFNNDGLEFLKNKRYIQAFLKNQHINPNSIQNQKELIRLFIEKNDVDYLICDFNIDKEISSIFKDTIRSENSSLRLYIR